MARRHVVEELNLSGWKPRWLCDGYGTSKLVPFPVVATGLLTKTVYCG
jgi:hypothetical protein